MKHYDIASVVIAQAGKYYLQLRNGSAQSGAMGQVGVFGGAIEPGETSQLAACRELAEETTLQASPKELEYICDVTFDSDKFNEPCTAHADIYLIRVSRDVKVEAIEGELIGMTLAEMKDNFDHLSPVSKAFHKAMTIQEQ